MNWIPCLGNHYISAALFVPDSSNRAVMLCTSSFIDVMFAHNGWEQMTQKGTCTEPLNGGQQAAKIWHCCIYSNWPTRWQHWTGGRCQVCKLWLALFFVGFYAIRWGIKITVVFVVFLQPAWFVRTLYRRRAHFGVKSSSTAWPSLEHSSHQAFASTSCLLWILSNSTILLSFLFAVAEDIDGLYTLLFIFVFHINVPDFASHFNCESFVCSESLYKLLQSHSHAEFVLLICRFNVYVICSIFRFVRGILIMPTFCCTLRNVNAERYYLW